jgi:hypothetical protein
MAKKAEAYAASFATIHYHADNGRSAERLFRSRRSIRSRYFVVWSHALPNGIAEKRIRDLTVTRHRCCSCNHPMADRHHYQLHKRVSPPPNGRLHKPLSIKLAIPH